MTTAMIQGSGEMQGRLWSAAAEDWAEIQEPTALPVFQAVLADGGFAGARVLDVGCGSGLFPHLMSFKGAWVTGLDASGVLLDVARRRSPQVVFEEGDMEALPFADASFDIVTAINALQYATDPKHALSEIRRVTRSGGRVFVATWGVPARCEAAAYLNALKTCLPPAPPNTPGPFALSDPWVFRAFAAEEGLVVRSIRNVETVFDYPDLDTALRGLLSAGPATRAMEVSGRMCVRDAVMKAIAPFRQPSGGYRMANQFRLLSAHA